MSTVNNIKSWLDIAGEGDAKSQLDNRQLALRARSASQQQYDHLFQTSLDIERVSAKNCENLIGSVEIPVGVAGPLLFELDKTKFQANIPLATTEGALVASVNRGSKILTQAKHTMVNVEKRGMTRSPVFECPNGQEALKFKKWFEEHRGKIAQVAESTSSHLHLLDVQIWVRGRFVYVRFAFDTEEAMGMNMVTIALQEALQEALHRNPEIKLVSLSSNVCTDKKDSVINSLYGRGYWVQAEVLLPQKLLQEHFKTTADKIFSVHHKKNLVGSNLAGSFSQNAHVANVLSAFYIATGQDPAHVVEGSKAFLQLEADQGDLYAALTLPNINVGVVGGGTAIKQQQEARALIFDGQAINTRQLAAVVGVASLAGELSLLAALAEHQLAFAHAKLGR